MKVFITKYILTITLFLYGLNSYSQTTSFRNDIKLTIEDIVSTFGDVDLNDLVTCNNFAIRSNNGDNIVNALSISISSVAAGADFLDAFYFKNPCLGPAKIEIFRPGDSCSSDTVVVNVNNHEELVEITPSFTQDGFSPLCTKSNQINVFSNQEVCAPKKFL